MTTRILATALVAFLGLGLGQGARAAETDDWQFEVTPYLLAAGLEGTTGVKGVTADIDVGFDDILDDLEMGFMGIFTARKGPWTLNAEAVYFKLDSAGARSVSGPFGNVNVDGALEMTSKMYIYQGSVGYRVLDGRTKVNVLGAVRFTKVSVDSDVKIATTPAIIFPGGSTSAKGSKSWYDFVGGATVHHPLTENTVLFGYADVGGGGSDLTYQFIAGAGWAFSEGYTARAGYRHISWDYKNGGFTWDIEASGPYLGLGITF